MARTELCVQIRDCNLASIEINSTYPLDMDLVVSFQTDHVTTDIEIAFYTLRACRSIILENTNTGRHKGGCRRAPGSILIQFSLVHGVRAVRDIVDI